MRGPISLKPKDVVGIKVNCSGAPDIRVGARSGGGIVDNLMALGVPARKHLPLRAFP